MRLHETPRGDVLLAEKRAIDSLHGAIRSQAAIDGLRQCQQEDPGAVHGEFGITSPSDASQWFQAAIRTFEAPAKSLAAILRARRLWVDQSVLGRVILARVITALGLAKLGEAASLIRDELAPLFASDSESSWRALLEECAVDLQIQALTRLVVARTALQEFREALDESMSWLGLDPSKEITRQEAKSAVQTQLANADRGLATIFLWRVSTLLGMTNRADDEVVLLETRLGFLPSSYESVTARQVRTALEGISEREALQVLLELSEALGFCGRNSDKLRLLEAALETRGARYDAPDLRRRLQEVLAPYDPGDQTRTVHELAVALGFEGRDQEKIALMLSWIGTTRAGLKSDSLAEFVRDALAHADAVTSCHFVRELSSALEFEAGAAQIRWSLLCAWIGLQDQSRAIEVDRVLAALENKMQGLPSNTAFAFRLEVASAFGSLSGSSARLQILESFSPHSGVAPSNVSIYVRSLAEDLALRGNFDQAVAHLERFAELGPGAYSKPESLAVAVASLRDRCGNNNAWTYLQELALALRNVGRHRDALALLCSAIGATTSDLDHPDRLAEKARSALSSVYRGNACTLIRALGDALGHGGHGVAKPGFLLRWMELKALEAQDDGSLCLEIKACFRSVDPTNAAGLIHELSMGLRAVSRVSEAYRCLTAFLGRVEAPWTPSEVRPLLLKAIPDSTVTAANLAQEVAAVLALLARFGESATVLAGWLGVDLDEADGVACAIDRLLAPTTGLTWNNALSFTTKLGTALFAMGRIADARALMRNAQRFSVDAIPETLCLCAEQRLRSLRPDALDEYDSAASDAMTGLRRGYGRAHVGRDDQRSFIDHIAALRRVLVQVGLEALQGSRGDPAALERRAVRLLVADAELSQRRIVERMHQSGGPAPSAPRDPGHRESRHEESPIPSDDPHDSSDSDLLETVATTPRSAWPSDAASATPETDLSPAWSAEELTESDLARLLDEPEILLRASFDLGGHLHWLAFRRDGDSLRLVAMDDDRSHPSDLEHVAWSTALFSLQRTILVRDTDRPYRPPPEPSAGIHDFPERLVASKDPEALLTELQGCLAQAIPSLADQDLVDLLQKGRRGGHVWLNLMARIWPEVVAAWREPRSPDRNSRLDSLDRATENHLARLACVLRLAPLRPHLHAATQMTLSVDEALFSVPFPLLPIGTSRFCEVVRSLRTWISPLAEARQRSREEPARGDAGVFALSHFEPSQPKLWSLGRELRQRHAQLAKEFDLSPCLPQDEQSEGSLESLHLGLDSRPLAVASVMGHGAIRSGIALSDHQHWDGSGIELSGVELLALISCSLGRMDQGRNRDAEGFCANLTISNARSVLAFRHPVRGGEAVEVMHAILREFLRRRTRGQPLRGLRAQVLNDVRRLLLTTRSARLDTLTGLELYGLP